MRTEFCCVGAQPPATCSEPLAASWAFFFGLYGPPLPTSLTQLSDPLVTLTVPQSLYGTPCRPTVQSSRGSTALMSPATNCALETFQVAGAEIDNGSPAASTLKELTRFCDGWLKPQQPKGLPEY